MKLDSDYSPSIVVLSYFIAFLGSYVAISLCEQLRICYMYSKNRFNVVKWFLLTGVAVGGVAIWAMHFIGMSSMSIKHPTTHENLDIYFDIGISIASLLAVTVMVTVGVVVSSYDPLFMKSKAEIIEMFVENAKKLSMKEIKTMSAKTVLLIICTKNLSTLVIGGVIAGSGVSVMHYIGMEAMEFQGT